MLQDKRILMFTKTINNTYITVKRSLKKRNRLAKAFILAFATGRKARF